MSTTAFFACPKVLRRVGFGPLGVYVDEFAALLQREGYSKRRACSMIRVISRFSRWLYERYLAATDFNPHQVARFLAHCRRSGSVGRNDLAALQKMQKFLTTKGVIVSVSVTPAVTPADRVKQDFTHYLREECGFSATTQRNYLLIISQFLAERYGVNPVELSALAASDVIGFVQRHAHHYGHSRASLMVKALRSFLRHLRHRGEIVSDLAACVPAVANRSFAELPKFLLPGQVKQVLDHCDRATVVGRRDYAILLLLARLGLRAGEVTSLRLDDIDWEKGLLAICGKGGRWSEMPLPADVGEAISAYLCAGRPSCSDRSVFVRACAPRTGFAGSNTVSALVASALERAGVECARKGAHVFRHTLATEMLRRGASLREIGELLRHRELNTTRIYARVDLSSLRELSAPWPGGGQ